MKWWAKTGQDQTSGHRRPQRRRHFDERIPRYMLVRRPIPVSLRVSRAERANRLRITLWNIRGIGRSVLFGICHQRIKTGENPGHEIHTTSQAESNEAVL